MICCTYKANLHYFEMKSIDLTKLEKAKTEKFNFNIGKYFNEAITIFGSHWQQFALYTFVSGLILFLSFFTLIGPLILTFPIQMGYGYVTEKIEKGENYEFNDFFYGFKYWAEFLGYSLLIILISICLMIPFLIFFFGFIATSESSPEISVIFMMSSILLYFVYFILIFIFSVISFLPPYLIFYGKLSASESLRTSWQICKKNFWYILLYTILFSILSQIGLYLCIIGIVASLPFSYIMNYFLIKDFLLTEDSESIQQEFLVTTKE